MDTIRRAFFVVVLLATAARAQANSETRDVTGFESIEVGGGIDLVLQQGDDFSVEVATEQGEIGDIVTEVRNGTLHIYRDFPDSWRGWRGWHDRWGGDDYSATVTLPVLESLQASGGSDVEAMGTLTGDRFTIRVSGGSDVELDVAVDTLRVTASGGSDVSLSGSANRLRAESSGGSDLDATGLTAK